MKTRLPASQEIEELVAFLPRLYTNDFTPIKKWNGGKRQKDGTRSFPWPQYEDVVEEFFSVASNEWWDDYDYDPDEAGRMLDDHDCIRRASLAEIKTMLTYCVRGERFFEGHWNAMISGGHIRRLLERLAELQEKKD